jgi:hypothetical protein
MNENVTHSLKPAAKRPPHGAILLERTDGDGTVVNAGNVVGRRS